MGRNVSTTADKLASYLRRLGSRRKDHTVNADDANRFLDRIGVTGSRLSVINSVFHRNNDKIVAVGTVESARPVARGRTITEWQYV